MKTPTPAKRRTSPAKRKRPSPRRSTAASKLRVIEMVPRVLGIRRILVPVDFSDPSTKALRYAVSFARQFDAKITLLHVRPMPYYPAEFGGFPTTIPANEPSNKIVRERLDADARRFIPPELRERTLVHIGTAFDEICKAARKLKADLIIIATHGHTGLKHILLGSTAERVVRHAQCPVLIVREHERDFA